jgi:ribonuclease HI
MKIAMPIRRHAFPRAVSWFSSISWLSDTDPKIRAFIEQESTEFPNQQLFSTFEESARTVLDRMRVTRLREELVLRGLSIAGSREELVNSLLLSLETENEQMRLARTTSDNFVRHPIQRDTFATNLESRSHLNNLNLTNQQQVLPKIESQKQYIVRMKGISDKKSNGTGIGIIIQDKVDNTIVWMARKYLPRSRTMFEAEYTALIMALRLAHKKGVRNFTVQIDQEVLMNHLSGKYPVEKESLKPMYWNVMKFKEDAFSFDVELISKLLNLESEELAYKALATFVSVNFELEDSTTEIDPMGENDSITVGNNDMIGKSHQLQVGTNRRIGKASNPNVTFPDSTEKEFDSNTMIDPSKTYLLQFDGGARGNPSGKAGAGMVLYDLNGQEIWCGWKFLGTAMSNNQAEYYALLYGLQCSRSLGIKKLRCEGDSDLIVKQLNGVYEVRSPVLRELWKSANDVLQDFEHYELHHIFREKNKRADWLANNAMDLQSSHGFDEISNPC